MLHRKNDNLTNSNFKEGVTNKKNYLFHVYTNLV
jgi:hypothetical protein